VTLVFHACVASGVLAPAAIVSLGFATRAALIASLTTGYVFFATRFGALGSASDHLALGRPSPPDEESLHRYAPDGRWRSRRAGVIGVLFFLLTLEVPNALAGAPPLAAWRSLTVLSWLQMLGVLFFFVTGRAVFASLGAMREMRALATTSVVVDLLDLRPLAVFARAAARNGALWLFGFSLASLVFLNAELRIRDSLVVFLPIAATALGIAWLAVWHPLRGIHVRIRDAKREELERIQGALRGEPGALHGSRIAGRADALSLADLLAYRRLVEDVSPWTLGGSLLRLLLIFLIPVLSWVGGALVERLVAGVVG
jgi:hypothetical protein